MKRAFILFLVQHLLLMPDDGWSSPRSYLRTESGYAEPEQLSVDGTIYKVSNPLMNTYDIGDFDSLKEKDPVAWRALYNHDRYGIAGTRGFAAGLVLSAATALTSYGRAHPIVPIGLFIAGAIYGLNSRHMARHNLHKAVNILNGIEF